MINCRQVISSTRAVEGIAGRIDYRELWRAKSTCISRDSYQYVLVSRIRLFSCVEEAIRKAISKLSNRKIDNKSLWEVVRREDL